MFFGSTSSRSASGSCWRRQRLRRAMATARLASCWPTMKRSSSETISRGLKLAVSVMSGPSRLGPWVGRRAGPRSQAFQSDVVVGVDADVAGDLHRLARHRLGIQLGALHEGAGGGQGEGPAGADADQP